MSPHGVVVFLRPLSAKGAIVCVLSLGLKDMSGEARSKTTHVELLAHAHVRLANPCAHLTYASPPPHTFCLSLVLFPSVSFACFSYQQQPPIEGFDPRRRSSAFARSFPPTGGTLGSISATPKASSSPPSFRYEKGGAEKMIFICLSPSNSVPL